MSNGNIEKVEDIQEVLIEDSMKGSYLDTL